MDWLCLKAKEPLYFFPLSPQEFLVLIWLTTEGWMADLTLEPTIGITLETPVWGLIPLGGSKVISAFHPFVVNQVSNQELLGT